MRQFKLIIAALLVFGPLAAHADFIYDWEGVCSSGCAGTATAVITLTDAYTPGSVVGQTDGALFVSLFYSSSSFSFSISNAELDTTVYLFTIDPTSFLLSQIATDDSLGTGGYPFLQWSSDSWVAGLTIGVSDQGGTSSLTARAVPEPGTLALLGIGLLGMGLARRKV